MLNKFAKVAATVVLAVSAGVAADAQSILSVITLPNLPEGVAANYLTNRIYVAVPSFGGSSDSLVVIDGKTDTILTTVTIAPVAYAVAVDVVRNLIYVGGSYTDVNGVQQNQVAVVSGRRNTQRQVIQISTTAGAGITGLAVNPFNGDVYVANGSDNEVDVIHQGEERATTVSRISVAPSPFDVAVNPFARQVYASLSDGTADVINARHRTITATTTVGGTNAGIAADWITGNVFVVDNAFGTSTVGVLDKNGNVLATVPVGNTPFWVDVDMKTNLAFVTNTQDGTVSVIDGTTNTVTSTVPVTGLYLAVNPATQKVYVGGQDSTISVITEK